MKSVLIVADFACINGGQAKVAIDSAVLLADEGIDVTYFAAVGPADPLLEHPNISVELLGQNDILAEPSRFKAAVRGIWNGSARKRLIEVAKRFDPQSTILHCHGYAKALSPSIGPILTDGPLAAVYTMHEFFLACPNGGFFDYPKNTICNRKALGFDCLTTNCDVRHPAHIAWRVLRQAATWGPGCMPRRMQDIIYISETQRHVLSSYLSQGSRLHYVPNPIARPKGASIDAAKNDIFLFVGRLNPEKGCVMFAEAARRIGVEAVFVGDGAQSEAIRAVNPDANILGWQSPEEVQVWLRRARALVFPSLWYETFGLTAYEALAQNVPVVCGTWTAAAEAIVHGRTGVLYGSADVESLTDAMDQAGHMTFDQSSVALDELSPAAHRIRLLDCYNAVLRDRVWLTK